MSDTDNPIERKIVRDLAACLIAAGMPVTVDYNEDEPGVLASTDLDAIENAAMDVDDCWLLVNPEGEGYNSYVRLIFGNGNLGLDCISDYTTDLEGVIQPVIDWIRKPTFADMPRPLSEDEKMRRVGAAAVQVEAELLNDGKMKEAHALISAFAVLPKASMARLYDLLLTHDTPAGSVAELEGATAPG